MKAVGVLFKIRAIKCRVDMWREKNRLNQSKGLRALKCRFSLVLRIVSLDDMSLNTVFYLIFFFYLPYRFHCKKSWLKRTPQCSCQQSLQFKVDLWIILNHTYPATKNLKKNFSPKIKNVRSFRFSPIQWNFLFKGENPQCLMLFTFAVP